MLGDPVRRRLYELVARAGEPVDRDVAAEGVGIGRPLAAFHLDRLANAGLLDVVYRRRTGRSGPGAGRPAKFYLRPPETELSVQLPPRSYDLAAALLAEGVEKASAARNAVFEAARRRGEAVAAESAPAGTNVGLIDLLEHEGYEPFVDHDATVRLRNCPFHALVEDHRALTCAMNFALLDGVTSAIQRAGYHPVAEPREGLCCVAFVPDAPGNSLPEPLTEHG